jgi:hypothetical protein
VCKRLDYFRSPFSGSVMTIKRNTDFLSGALYANPNVWEV